MLLRGMRRPMSWRRANLAPREGKSLSRLVRRGGALGGDRSGIAAVEFSLILPAMLLIFVATGELANSLEMSRKTGQFTRTIADLFGRTQVGNAKEVFDAAGVIMQPFDIAKAQIRVSAMGVVPQGTSYVAQTCSSVAQGTAPRARSTPADALKGGEAVPEAFRYPNARYILVEVRMPFRSVLGSNYFNWIKKADVITFNESLSWPERPDQEIVLPGGRAC